MDELDAEIGYRAPDGEYETLGGLLMAALGRIPTVGDCVELPQRQDNSEDNDLDDAEHATAARVERDGPADGRAPRRHRSSRSHSSGCRR
jgi:CBS domain containing-hemolysin-like protein